VSIDESGVWINVRFCFSIAGNRRSDEELDEILENGFPGTFSFSVRFFLFDLI
jgi:hypothetical protein